MVKPMTKMISEESIMMMPQSRPPGVPESTACGG